jgi:hypothetical protein
MSGSRTQRTMGIIDFDQGCHLTNFVSQTQNRWFATGSSSLLGRMQCIRVSLMSYCSSKYFIHALLLRFCLCTSILVPNINPSSLPEAFQMSIFGWRRFRYSKSLVRVLQLHNSCYLFFKSDAPDPSMSIPKATIASQSP